MQVERRKIGVTALGTMNVLKVAFTKKFSSVVLTSTTSLMVTDKVSEMKAKGSGKCAFLDEALTGWEGPPRNKYGRTKLEAERRACHYSAVTGLPVMILRTSRFFPEDILPEQLHAGKVALSLPNIKANELLGGRVSLEDVVDAHLRALCRAPELRGSVMVLAAPTPFVREDSTLLGMDALPCILKHFPGAASTYSRMKWSLPKSLSKVYMADKALGDLKWSPRWTFARLLDDLDQTLAGRAARGAY